MQYLPTKIDSTPQTTGGAPLNHHTTYEDYKCSWEKARETTASSPSSIHFGHYIAGITDDIIGELNAILANDQLLSSTAPEHWKQTLT